MTNNKPPRAAPRSGSLYDFDELDVPAQNLSKPEYITSEMFALQTMGEMIESYRHDILRWRQEYKKLRDQESNQELVNLHIRHRMAEIQKSIGNGIEAWSALRADYFVQRACIMGRKNKKA